MAGIIEVCAGWILGIGSSYLYRIYDRNEKKYNFINGVQAELQELLPRLVSNVWVMKSHLGHIDHDVLGWIASKSIPENDFINDLLKYPSEEVLISSTILAAQKDRTKPSLKMFYLDYIESNIDMLPLMDENIQKLIIKITSRLKLVNQAIDSYQF